MAELNINRAVPNGPVDVTVQPGNSVIHLLDDGKGPDPAAGDGVFWGVSQPPGPGDYTFTFPGGDTWRAKVVAAYAYSALLLLSHENNLRRESAG
ncbi:MAG: hypothetical protein JOY71_25015 [Acetobacteraceae bacterium]|nr:hypothetical protein [Acetobacteraceae bacterium]MBV8525343.1 hypothetical protein [Acetobacteraceae bacterium]